MSPAPEIRVEVGVVPFEKENHTSSLKSQVKVALSPIRLLPTEIFIEVFRHGVVVNAFDRSKGPWILAQVCSIWREIIITHCPRLWSTILIEICAYRCQDPVSLLKTVLDRSGQSDLRIEFWETSIEEYARQTDAQSTVRSVEPLEQCHSRPTTRFFVIPFCCARTSRQAIEYNYQISRYRAASISYRCLRNYPALE